MEFNRRQRAAQVLSGDVCTLHLILRTNYQDEQGIWKELSGSARSDGSSSGPARSEDGLTFEMRLKKEMLAPVHEILGLEFDIRNITFRRGSIEIFVTIAAAYYAVSKYKNFYESINLLSSQIANVAQRYLRVYSREDVGVAATWIPGPALVRLETMAQLSRAGDSWAYPLLWYVILSHAALLAVCILLLLK